MKILSIAFALLVSTVQASPCGGSPVGFWTNADGSRGGWVGKDAKVQTGAVIAPGAEVCEFAQVKSGAQVLGQARIGGRAVISAGSIIEGRAKVMGEAKIGGAGGVTKVGGDATVEGLAVITGSSNVFARAKVSGGARVHNSIICQASVIEGTSVENSDYYCQTEDPEPPHPGETGKATLLGVDVDRDGVRDDLEIWVNEKYSNTPNKNRRLERMNFKALVQDSSYKMRNANNRERLLSNTLMTEELINCLSALDPEGFYIVLEEYQAHLMNTEERFKTYMGLQKNYAGLSSKTKRKGKDACIHK